MTKNFPQYEKNLPQYENFTPLQIPSNRESRRFQIFKYSIIKMSSTNSLEITISRSLAKPHYFLTKNINTLNQVNFNNEPWCSQNVNVKG